MNFLKDIWDFPTHHAAMGWWIAAVLTSWNILWNIFSGLLGRLSIWSRQFRVNQLGKRIRNLEYVHDNAYRLIHYLASDAAQIAVELSSQLIMYSVLFSRVIPVHTSAAIYILCINLGSSVIGRAMRVRTFLNDLNNYPLSVANLQAKLSSLESKQP